MPHKDTFYVFDAASQLSFLQSDFIYPQLVFFIAFLRLSVLFTCILLFTAFLPFSCFLLCGDEACQRRLVAAWPEKSAALTFGIYMDGLNEP